MHFKARRPEGLGALAARCVCRRRVMAAAPPASAITPDLIEAAKKEGKVVYYTSIDLPVAEKIAKAFEAKYPGIAVRVERTGAERVFQRIGQEYASRIHAVDVVNSSDAAHFIVWKRERASWSRTCPRTSPKLSGRAQGPGRHVRELPRLGLRHRLQHQPGEGGGRAEELCRPARSEMEGQDRQGASRLQRHHHDRDLPDGARPRLGVLREARQAEGHAGAVLGRSAEEARARRARRDGRRQRVQHVPAKEKGKPVEIVYATEGTPLIVGPNGIFKNAPNPNAARLFQSYMLLGRGPAAHHRRRRPALGASAGQGEARAQAVRARSRP